MDASTRGQLGRDTVADLLRDVAESRSSGSLRLTSNKQIKVIFFESGRPVYAISSHVEEQPEHRFVEEGIATVEQVLQARRINSNPNQVGQALTAMGVASVEVVQSVLKALALRIIISAFEWRDGEFVFDPKPNTSHQVNIECTAQDCILGGARRTALVDEILNSTVGPSAVVAPGEAAGAEFGRSAKLNSIEGFVLSCITSPIQAGDISGLTGLSDLEIRRAIHVLRALRLIAVVENPEPVSEPLIDTANDAAGIGSGVFEEVFLETGPLAGGLDDGTDFIKGNGSRFAKEETLIDFASVWNNQQWEPGPRTEERTDPLEIPIVTASVSRVESEAGDRVANAANNRFSQGASAPARKASSEPRVNLEEPPAWLGGRATEQPSAPLSQDPIPSEPRYSTVEPLEQVLSKLENRLGKSDPSNLYQILGVTKLASKSTIQGAYEGLKRAYESYRFEWPDNTDLISRVTSLETMAANAYEILSDPEKRRLYDMPKSTPMVSMPVIERGESHSTRPAPPKGELSAPVRKPLPIEIPKSVAPPPGVSVDSLTAGVDGFRINSRQSGSPTVSEAADNYYRRGRAFYDRHDFHTAAHMLREAVRLAPGRASYHYHLGLTLAVLSQARAVHRHDEGCHVTCKLGGGLQRNQRIRHEAEQHLLKAAEIEPTNADIKLRLALLYKDAGMEKKAEQYFHEVLML
ncbi:MAG TPA: DUF4388 domain-containing protein, partial [Blastocatellia bacterium]